MNQQTSREARQIQWLAKLLMQDGQRPSIGGCLHCKKTGKEADCGQCWVDASGKVADALMAAEKMRQVPAAWGGDRTRAVASPIPFTRTAPHEWPEAWQEFLALSERHWFCFTWPNMHVDHHWQDDRDIVCPLIEIMRGLGWLDDANCTFWPCDWRDYFWSGIRELGCRIIAIFGPEAAKRVGLPEGEWRPLHWEIRNGVILATLWDFADMQEHPSRIDDCVTFLSATFRQLRLTSKEQE